MRAAFHVPWHDFPFALSPFLLSGTTMFQAPVVLSLRYPWNQPFLKGALIQFSGGYLEIKIFVLVCLLLLGYRCSEGLSMDRSRRCVGVCAHACVCVCLHLYLFLDFFLCIENHKVTLIPLILIHYHGVHSSFLSIFITSFFHGEKSHCHSPQ